MLRQASIQHHFRYRWLVGGLFCTFLFSFAAVQAASIKLTGPEAATGLFQISPDNRYVVYAANLGPGDSFLNLYSVPLSGGLPVLLNLALPVEPITAYIISPDGSQVIYQQGVALYHVPIAGPASARVNLNHTALTAASQHPFALSADGRTVVYRVNDDLYRVPLTGPDNASIKLNIAELLPAASGLPGIAVSDFMISPDSHWVIYVARAGAAAFGLYSVPLTGLARDSVLLSAPTPGADITWVTVSLDSQQVIYLSDQATDMTFELYRVPIAGPANHQVKLNVPLKAGESVYQYAVSADAARVVYAAGSELYSVPLAGPAAASVKLNQAGTTARLDAFAISTDSQSVVFHVGNLYQVPIVGPASAITPLTDSIAGGRGVSEFQISPDNQRVIYTAYATATSALELYSVPLLGPLDDTVKLNHPLATTEQPLSFHINSNSQRVVYEAYQDAADTNELYTVPIAGPASLGAKLSEPVASNGRIRPWHWQLSDDSSRVVYAVGTSLFVADNGGRMVSFALAPITIDHETASATLPMTLDQASVMSVTLAYSVTLSRTPDNGDRHSLVAGVLTFTPGETQERLSIVFEPSELRQDTPKLELFLSNPQNATLATDKLTWLLSDNWVLVPELRYNYLPVMPRSARNPL